MREISCSTTLKFDQEFKKLAKKYRSLEEDLIVAKKAALELFHIHMINNQSVFPMPQYCSEKLKIYKLKKFACRALKGRGVKSGIRIIYAFFPETYQVTFLEIYFKADQENEDRERIKGLCNNNLHSP